jgi:hypothetical protein
MGIEVKNVLVLSAIIVSLAVVGGLTISSPNNSMAIAPTVLGILERLTVTENNVADVFIKIGDIKGEVIETNLKLDLLGSDVFHKIGDIKGELIETNLKLDVIKQDVLNSFSKIEISYVKIADLKSEVDLVKNSILDASKIYQTSKAITLPKTLTKFTVMASCNNPTDIILSAGIGASPGFTMESSDPISSNSWEFGLKNNDIGEGDVTIISKATCVKLSP